MDPKYAEQLAYASKSTAVRDINPDSFASTAVQANDRMGDLMARLSMVTDRLCGGAPPSPDTPGMNQIRGIPNGHFEEAADNSRAVMLKIEAANRCLDRIERALP